jgi:hypothetical protein
MKIVSIPSAGAREQKEELRKGNIERKTEEVEGRAMESHEAGRNVRMAVGSKF